MPATPWTTPPNGPEYRLTSEEAIRLAFLDLRDMCDPRGHGMLDALEEYVLEMNAELHP